MSEKILQGKIVKKLKALYGALTFKFESPGNAGVPDLVSIIPHERCPCCGSTARVVFVEVKNPNGRGRLSELQKAQIARIQDAGGEVYVTDTIDIVDTLGPYPGTVGGD
tara:strand:+ start:859 stop:1185 length:327 start_codon:yes stop_codon:yes gene_type:complete